MASDSQLELRVSRLENDTRSIYDLIGEIRSTQQEHSERFERVDERFDKIDERFERVDERFEKIDERFEKIDGRFDEIGERFDKIETTLVEVVRRLPDPS